MKKSHEEVISSLKNFNIKTESGFDDDEMVTIIAYLRELGFPTWVGSYGRIEVSGLAHAWINFISPYGDVIMYDKNSIYNKVQEDIRNKINKLEEELGKDKFKENYGSWTDLYYIEIEKHPKYSEYLKEVEKLESEYSDLLSKVQDLVKDFCKEKNVSLNSLSFEKVSQMVRFNFCTQEDLDYQDKILEETGELLKDKEIRKNIKEKSDSLVTKFEEYLIDKYNI